MCHARISAFFRNYRYLHRQGGVVRGLDHGNVVVGGVVDVVVDVLDSVDEKSAHKDVIVGGVVGHVSMSSDSEETSKHSTSSEVSKCPLSSQTIIYL